MSFKDLSGEFCVWDDEVWYVDHSDIDVIGDDEKPSYFVLPPEYANSDKNEELFEKGNVDNVGYWVYCSDVEGFDDIKNFTSMVDNIKRKLTILKEFEHMNPENIDLQKLIFLYEKIINKINN